MSEILETGSGKEAENHCKKEEKEKRKINRNKKNSKK